MALARVKTWVAFEVLSAADLNAEFNNILNNALALISPLTGNLNFNNTQALSFRAENLGASPAAGQAGRLWFNTATSVKQVEVDDGSLIRAVPSLASSNMFLGNLVHASTANSWTQVRAAWVAFAGNTTSSGVTPLYAIGVSTANNSITQISSGRWSIPWINSFPSANYMVQLTPGRTTEGSGHCNLMPTSSVGLTSSQIEIQAQDAGSLVRPFYISVLAYGPI